MAGNAINTIKCHHGIDFDGCKRFSEGILSATCGLLTVLILLCSPAQARSQCAQPRNLCPDPNVCFMSQEAEQKWADEKNCTFITLAMLSAVNPSGTEEMHSEIIAYLNKYARHNDVNTPLRMAHFLSQVAHESHLNPRREESIYYRPKTMRRTFGCVGGSKNYDERMDDCSRGRLRPKLWTLEDTYARNPESLGNYVYASRLGNGDETSGEGYKYRGRGMIQLTGKKNYQAFEDYYNRQNANDPKSFVENPDLLLEDAEFGVASAFHYWHSNNLNSTASNGSVCQVTRRVNGGSNGYADRKQKFNKVGCLLGAGRDNGTCG